VPINIYQQLVERINQQGGRAVVDSHSEALQLAIEAKPWLVRLNRYILEMLLKRRLDTIEDTAEAARMIQQQGVEFVCVSLGGEGAILLDADNSYHCEAPKVHKQSTVGCGDSLVAGLIAAANKGESPGHMLRLGVVCGSATASHPGTGLFTREQLEALTRDVEVTQLSV
jgi:6-phosphofructokinase 2